MKFRVLKGFYQFGVISSYPVISDMLVILFHPTTEPTTKKREIESVVMNRIFKHTNFKTTYSASESKHCYTIQINQSHQHH